MIKAERDGIFTFSAEMICSGAIVFLLSFSQISFASEDTRWMNSEKDCMS